VQRPDYADSEHRRQFGDRVRALRTEAGLTQERLAELARLDRSYLANVEGGGRNPTLDVIHRLSIALKVDISDLFA
jgi:transcriptional regulator with XRE-family HTH domain